MPARAAVPSTHASRLLVLFADGGALTDLNDRRRADTVSRAEDSAGADRPANFLDIPQSAADALKAADGLQLVECPLQARLLFILGSAPGASFQQKMAAQWSVEALPLGMCRYERASSSEAAGRGSYRVRFHANIAYRLGFLASGIAESSRPVTVGVVSDDPQFIEPLADLVRRGIDARLVWYASTLPDEVAYFAARNHVKFLPIESARTDPPKLSHVDKIAAILK